MNTSTWVVIEYLEPVSPTNRRVWDSGCGPLVFEDTVSGAMDFFSKIGGAPGNFRVVPVEYARKAGLFREQETRSRCFAGGRFCEATIDINHKTL
jgi:phosphosulfolactate synthase (CoM biosynthesis protein A)